MTSQRQGAKFLEPNSEEDGKKRLRDKFLMLAVAFLAIQIGATGVKLWQDARIDTEREEQRLEAVLGQMNAQIEEQRSILATAIDRPGGGRVTSLQVEAAVPGSERVFRVRPEGPRLRLADPVEILKARWLVENNRSVGVTANNLIVIHRSGRDTWAMAVPLFAVFDGFSENELALSFAPPGRDQATIGLGNDRAIDFLADPDRFFAIDRAWTKKVRACSPVLDGAAIACVASVRPLGSWLNMISVLAYISLSLAPILAIVTVMSRPIRKRLARDRIMSGESEFAHSSRHNATGTNRVLEINGVGTWRTDDTLKSIRVTGQPADWLGVPSGQDVTFDEAVSNMRKEAGAKFVEALSRARRQGTISGVVDVGLGDRRRFLEFRGCVDPDGKGGLSGIVIDVTRRKQFEDQIRASEARFRSALEGVSLPIALWDNRRRLVFWNQAFVNDFQLEAEGIRAGTSYDAISMAMSRAVRLDRSVETESGERELQLRDGRWIKLVERDTLSGLKLTMGSDLTALRQQQDDQLRGEKKLKRLVQELERSEGREKELRRQYSEAKTKAEHASQAKGSFLANMSHELRTPLNAINGFSEMLVKEVFGPLGDTRYKSYAQDILISGQHLLDMINDILDMAKIESGKMTINTKPIDPVEPVDAAVRMVRRKADEKKQTLTLDYSEDVMDIEADHRAIRQMVLNLVSNAIKFTRENGEIKVRIENHGPAHVAMSVHDNGVGISQEDLPRLANPFEQASSGQDMNHNGTGLGLALTRSLVEMHGGEFKIESELGSGTKVTLILPVQQPELPTSEEAA